MMLRFPFLLPAFFFFLAVLEAWSQPASAGQGLDFSSEGRIENRLEMRMPRRQFKAVRTTEGEKYDLEKVQFVLNGTAAEVKSIGLHGNSTLDFPRKSYSISLSDTAWFEYRGRRKGLQKFHLLSLSMDEYYYRNRLAFGCLQQLGLFPLFYTYAELRINGVSQGAYLVVQKPHDYALNELKAPALLRRHYYSEIKKTKVDKDLSEYGKEAYKAVFDKIYTLAKAYEQPGFSDSLDRRLDMDAYLQWLGFNYLVCNGDYTDELYFFAQPGIDSIRFGILPWDYDDIFAEEPHEGEFARVRLIGDRLIFSGEDALDRGIARNAEAYARYLKLLEDLCEQLTPELLKTAFENTYEELCPYFRDAEFLACTALDPKGSITLEGLQEEMNNKYQFLLKRREATFQSIQQGEKP